MTHIASISSIAHFSPTEANSLGKLRGSENLSLYVNANISDVGQPIQQTKRMQDGGVDAHPYGGVAILDALEGSARCERTIRNHGHS